VTYKEVNGTFYKQEDNYYDETYLNVEPMTGTAMNIILALQASFLLEGGDDLFPHPIKAFLPIFDIYRSANLTDDQIEENFGDL